LEARTSVGPEALAVGHYLFWSHGKSLTLYHDKSLRCFNLSERDVPILQTLCRKALADLEFHLISYEREKISLRNVTDIQSTKARIGVNIYGAKRLAESIGKFLQKCLLYLQEPVRCTRDLEYENPHCLPPLTMIQVTTFMLKSRDEEQAGSLACENLELFAELGSDEMFEEAPQPQLVSTSLYR
jgi:hypothetical protein